MLSYQHSYHAGCFADVMKHMILTRLLHYLAQKENPLLYLDTHAGRGRYDLKGRDALKTNEAQWGIHLLWEKRAQLSPLFSLYIEAIAQLNVENECRYYPGSPEIAKQILRSVDRLVFCELHPGEFDYLNKFVAHGRRVFLKKENGLSNLNALLPPLERRGLVFIDPSYERKIEYKEVVQALKMAYKRCSTMTYCVWFPYINGTVPPQFLKDLQSISTNHLCLEFHQTFDLPSHQIGMTGSGLWIINPPYTLAEEGQKMLSELKKIMNKTNSVNVGEQQSC